MRYPERHGPETAVFHQDDPALSSTLSETVRISRLPRSSLYPEARVEHAHATIPCGVPREMLCVAEADRGSGRICSLSGAAVLPCYSHFGAEMWGCES